MAQGQTNNNTESGGCNRQQFDQCESAVGGRAPVDTQSAQVNADTEEDDEDVTEDDLDEIDDDSQESREDSQDFPDESQDSQDDSNNDMDTDLVSRAPGPGSGNTDMPIERSGPQ